MRIIRGRLRSYGNKVDEFISVKGRIKALIEKNINENFDFTFEEGRRKSVKSFGPDFLDESLIGKEIEIVDKTYLAKFNSDGSINVIESKNESGKYKFEDFSMSDVKRVKSIWNGGNHDIQNIATELKCDNDKITHILDILNSNDEVTGFISESLPSNNTVNQLKRVMNLSKKTDIGNRISDMSKEGANIQWCRNPIKSGIESYEDFQKNNKSFKPSWNFKHLISPFSK